MKPGKSLAGFLTGEFWGAELSGKSGRLGYRLERRSSLAAATLCALAYGVSGVELMRLLGVWTFVLGFRRELLAVLDSAFVMARSLPRRRRIFVAGPVMDELLALCFLWPSMAATAIALRLSASG